ncbi:hypothetical protein J2S74_005374 [Evansella vedderi]|uniref:Uncharacterized protein n=1 Tax=Evansella vedderi TaxID=38282 RepID=A0ABU0A338_9BACI|nr:hypothetical protein [Evansella vedderi]MDQ0257911.1 hypothetical protein [Evansella vedderi]
MEYNAAVNMRLNAVDIVLRSVDHAKLYLTDGFSIVSDPVHEVYFLIPEEKIGEAQDEGYIVINE